MDPALFHQFNYCFKCIESHTKAEPLLPYHTLAHYGKISGCPLRRPLPALVIPSHRGTSSALCWPHNLPRQHTLTISISAVLNTTARNRAFSAYKHLLGSLSHNANHYRFRTKVWKKHDHPFPYWNATTFLTPHQVSPIIFSRNVPQTAIITTSHALDNMNQS